jgi:cytochrome P450
MKQILLAGFEEVQSAILFAVVAVTKNPQIQFALHAAMSPLAPATYILEELDKLPILLILCRLYFFIPPSPSLTNRYKTQQVLLGGNINLPVGA